MPEHLRAVRLRVGRNVERLRRARDLSQEGLAEQVGNTGKHIGQVERGEVNVGLDILTRIADALSVDVADLLMAQPRRPRSEPPTFAVTERHLELLEQVARSIRSAGVRADPATD